MKLESLAVVFVDIKNYTSKTSDQSRTANERLLAQFSSLVKPLVRAFNGKMVKALGDAFLITFKSPTDSLLCAMAVLDQLTRRNALALPEERFELRFAINSGEVRVAGKDVFGEAVNVAARIEALADGGEIYFSETVFLMMNRSEVPYEEVGLRKLKGIQNEVRIYRVPKLNEVGVYRLAMADPTAGAQTEEAPPLPFGGLALRRVHASVLRLTDADASFYLAGALSELHDNASVQAGRFGAGTGFWRVLAPVQYAGSMLFGLAAIPLSSGTYRGLGLRLEKDLKQIKDSAHYRARLMVTIASVLLLSGAGLLAWHRYALVQEAELQAREQAFELQAELRLKDQAAAHADAREAATRQELQQVQSKDAEAEASAQAGKKSKKSRHRRNRAAKPDEDAQPDPAHVPWW